MVALTIALVPVGCVLRSGVRGGSDRQTFSRILNTQNDLTFQQDNKSMDHSQAPTFVGRQCLSLSLIKSVYGHKCNRTLLAIWHLTLEPNLEYIGLT